MTVETLQAVIILGIAHVNGVKGARQGFFGRRNSDDVNMIGHQAVGQDLQMTPLGIFVHPRTVLQVIFFFLKDLLTIVAALSDVVRKIRDNNAGVPGHRLYFNRTGKFVHQK